MVLMALTGCAHESTITPSQGHIGSGQEAQTAATAPVGDIPKPVKKPAYVPPPKPKAKEQTFSVVVSDVPVKEVLFALARESKMNIDIHPDIKGFVTMNAVDQTLPSILERISKQVDLTYSIERDVLSIKPDSPVLKTYQINYVNMDRDTTGSVAVSAQIASVSSSSAGVGGTSTTTSSSGGNTSSTTVSSTSKNHYWADLIKNIEEILQESDKDILVRKFNATASYQDFKNAMGQVDATGSGHASMGIPSSSNSSTGNQINVGGSNISGSGNQKVEGSSLAETKQAKDEQREEYKRLYAAKIIANPVTGVLSVRATQRQHEKIQEFIDKVQANARRQVLIEATIVEISLNDQYQSGIDWSRLGSNGLLKGFTFKQELSNNALSSAPRFVIGYNNTSSPLGDLAASIKLLQTFGNTKVLSSPKLMVLNSQTAILKVVDELVYFTAKSDTTSNTNQTTTTVTTTPHTLPVGIWMSVTPQINENGSVILNVRPTISRKMTEEIQDPNPDLKIASKIPQIRIREMESVLQVGSGNTVILGGLMEDEFSKTSDNVPVMHKLPIIGKLFSSKDDNSTRTELIIFLRPTVITNASLESDELKSFKQFLPDQLPTVSADEPAN